MLSARRQFAAHRPDSVRAILKRIDQARRQALAGSIAPDAVLAEAVMYLSIGDTATATRVLDDVLGSARSYGPLGTGEDAWREVVWVGTLLSVQWSCAVACPAQRRRSRQGGLGR